MGTRRTWEEEEALRRRARGGVRASPQGRAAHAESDKVRTCFSLPLSLLRPPCLRVRARASVCRWVESWSEIAARVLGAPGLATFASWAGGVWYVTAAPDHRGRSACVELQFGVL